jgi:hypothetical protein
MKVFLIQYLIAILVLLFLVSCGKGTEKQKNLSPDHKRHIELEG